MPGKIAVGNIRDFLVPNPCGRGRLAQFPDEAHVWVGRQNGRWGLRCNPLHNPFRVGKPPWNGAQYRLTRKEAVELYRVYFADRGPEQEAELDRLSAIHEKRDLTLVCCETWDGEGDAPGLCHAEVVREELLRKGV